MPEVYNFQYVDTFAGNYLLSNNSETVPKHVESTRKIYFHDRIHYVESRNTQHVLLKALYRIHATRSGPAERKRTTEKRGSLYRLVYPPRGGGRRRGRREGG